MTPNMFKVNDENTRTMSFSLIWTEYGEKFKHIWRRSSIFIARYIFCEGKGSIQSILGLLAINHLQPESCIQEGIFLRVILVCIIVP